MMDIRLAHHATSACRGLALVHGLAVVALLSWTAGSHAQGDQRPRVSSSPIPALEPLPHKPLPRGKFMDWCGINDKIILEIDRKAEIYGGGVKASPLSFPLTSTLQCEDEGQKLAFVDNESGHVSEVDIARGI